MTTGIPKLITSLTFVLKFIMNIFNIIHKVFASIGGFIRNIIGFWVLFTGINKIVFAISIKSIDKTGFKVYITTYARDIGSILGSGRSPGKGFFFNPGFLPGESHGQRSLAGSIG